MPYSLSDLQFAARYPFTDAAKSMLSGRAVSISFDVMERAERRVAEALERENIPTLYSDDPQRLENELLSYPVAKMIVSSMDRTFLGKFINAEVRRATNYIRESENDWQRLAKEFGIAVRSSGIDVKAVDVKSYLRYMPKYAECSLVNQNIDRGFVILDIGRFLLLLNEAARTAVSAGMPIQPSLIPKELKTDVSEVASRLEERFRSKVQKKTYQPTSGEIAPCMKVIMENLRTGQDVPHVGRWALATYLMKKGFDIDAIVGIFSGAPNFNEKTTKYQLAFIQKKDYSVPLCANLDSYGICVAKCGTKSPLQYGSRFVGRFRRKENYGAR